MFTNRSNLLTFSGISMPFATVYLRAERNAFLPYTIAKMPHDGTEKTASNTNTARELGGVMGEYPNHPLEVVDIKAASAIRSIGIGTAISPGSMVHAPIRRASSHRDSDVSTPAPHSDTIG